jgi:hypothetical protein
MVLRTVDAHSNGATRQPNQRLFSLHVIATLVCFVWLEGKERRLFHAVADKPVAMASGASVIQSHRANTNDISGY